MTPFFMSNAIIIRLGFFVSIFIVVAIGEIINPRRLLSTSKKARWFSNISIILLNPIIVRVLFSITPISLALLSQENGWGLMNIYALPFWVKIVLGVMALDLVIYLQHVMFHAVPILWRVHMMHHADLDFDVTTGLRFHPIEIIISIGIKLAAIVVIGPSALAVLFFEILLNGTAMFNHSNIFFPSLMDRILRLIVVTPDMHRIHHSVIIRETNSNFGFNLPWWDRLFGTYSRDPAAGHDSMVIGLSQFRDEKHLSLPWLLVLPFIGKPGEYAINHHGGNPISRNKSR